MSDRKTMRATGVVVLGMHRSGTSALTACLQALGASLGHALVPPNDDNPGGYFENAAAVTAHDTLLAQLERGWEDLRDLPAGWIRSTAGRHAATQVRALLASEFADAPLWALKDPRLCRLLPLWQDPLADARVDARHVVLLRHPDEVVGSLVKRDGMAAEHGYLLWLRYVLDAMRDSAGARRVVLDYDTLLDAPADAMRRVGEGLGIDWPVSIEAAGLDAILDAGQRHHRPSADTPDAGSARAQALALYRDMTAATNPWPDGAAARAYLDRRVDELGPWLDDSGTALARVRREAIGLRAQCADVAEALQRVDTLSRDRLGQLHALQARVEATDRALQDAEALSIARLQELGALHARVAATDAALDEAKALSRTQLQELASLDRRVAASDAELAKAQALAIERLDAAAALDRQVAAIEAIALERLDQLGAQERRIASTDAELAKARDIALARLADNEAQRERIAATDAALREAQSLVAALQDRLTATESGLAQATALSLGRLDEIVALHARLKATDAALAESTALAIERMQAVEALQHRLDATDAALAHATRLATDRLAALDALQARLDLAASALHATEAALRASEQAVAARDATIATMQGSRSWRVTRPLRWLEAWMARLRGPR